MNNGEESSSRVEESGGGMDASPCSSLHYSSCGESEFDRYCSANSALGTPSVCGSSGPFHDSLDSDFHNFTLGPTLKLSDGGFAPHNTNIIQERDSMDQFNDDDDDDDDDSLPDHSRQNLCFLQHKEESIDNPFLINSSTAFGTNDWDESELEATQLNDSPFDERCAETEGMSTNLPGKGIEHTNLTVLNQREQGGVARDSITVRGSSDLSVDIKTLVVPPQSLVKEESIQDLSNNRTEDRPVAMNYLQSCDSDDVLDITPVQLGNEDFSCGIGHLDDNVSFGLLHESFGNANQSVPFGECTSEPLLASSNSDKPSSTVSHPVINALQVTNAQPKKENTELNDFYDDFVHDMEDILLDSGESSGARYSKSDKMFQLQLSLPNRDGGQTATTSGLEDSSPIVSQRFRIDRVEVVGVKQKKGDVSLSERLVGVKEYTVYVIRVWSGKDKWEIERRYRDFYSLYRRLTSLFADQGWTLPTPWASVERESRKIFGTSPNAVAERTVLIQDCLNSLLQSRFFPTLPNALLRFLSPQDASSAGSDSIMSPTGSASDTFAATSSSYGNTISLIVDIRPHKSVKQLLEAQHYICAGCHRYFDDGATLVRDFVKALGWGKPRLCEYTGQLFCSSCHTNDMAVLPARVLHHWDFNPYPVSQLAKSYLDSIHEQPMLCVSAVNPFLSSKVPALNHIMSIRKRITIMIPYVHCPFRKTLNKGLSTRRHLLESTDFFALRDLIDLSKGPFAALPAIVETVRKKILEHITEQCLVCCDVGVPCNARQACDDTSSLIFPFQEDEVNKCRTCGLVYHKRCFSRLSNCHCGTQLKPNPVDQIPRIDAQLSELHTVAAKYSTLGVVMDNKELDHFMSHYVVLLCSFKEQLQHHVCVHAMEAITACWEIEQSLQSITGVSPSENNGKTMSDDEDDNQVESEVNMFDGSLEGSDCMMGFGPLVPTERERSLLERVKKELKHELKQGFKEKIVDIREEIMRKRRAGKLPGDTTSVLKEWWRTHAKWPYPTEEDKAKLVQETGLQLKQINNWFINQRKRNWNSSSSTSSTPSKNKRKRTGKS